ncbi:hypothetical protein U3516DRAFT_641947 [Neocallimastix sp. 'constans']|jgi:hypothetical protein
MATTITQPTLIFSHNIPVNHIISSTNSISHSNAIKRPHKLTSSSIQYIKKSTSHEPCVKSAIVFAFSLNDIIKSYLPDKKFRSDKEKIEVHFAQKLIGKIQLNFSELVLTLVYCNRYLKHCRKYKLPMPGSPGSIFPSMTHMIIPCVILAEVYLVDCPHNSVWWANKCSGGVTVEDINRWKRDVLVTMKYWLYIEPTRDYVNWTRQIKKLAFALFGKNSNSLKHSLSSNCLTNDNTNKPNNNNNTPTPKIDSSSQKKVNKPSNSSSFHNSLQNHLNTISSCNHLNNYASHTTNNNEISIKNLLNSKYSFNKTNSSLLSNFCPSTLLNVINNNASAKMAVFTDNSSFIPNENHQENIIDSNQEKSNHTFDTKITNNPSLSINGSTSTSNSSQNINQSTIAKCSDNEIDDNTHATSIHHQSTIGRSRTIHNPSGNSIINTNSNIPFHVNVNAATQTTKSEPAIYPHLSSYIRSATLTDLHYIGSNGQQIGSSLLSNLDYLNSNDSKVEQSFFRMSMAQKPPPLPLKYISNSMQSNYIPSSQFNMASSSSSSTATNQSYVSSSSISNKIEDPFSTSNTTSKFHYPFHCFDNDQNNRINQNQSQNNLLYPSNNYYTTSTPGSSCSEVSTTNIHSTCDSLISPKSFISNISTSTSTSNISHDSSVSNTTDSSISSTENLKKSMMKNYNNNENNYTTNFQSGLNNFNNDNNNNDLFYLDYKKLNYLPSDFNPHCSKFIKENSNHNNSKNIERSNSRSNGHYFKILVKTELDDSLEEERKLISPPHTPN